MASVHLSRTSTKTSPKTGGGPPLPRLGDPLPVSKAKMGRSEIGSGEESSCVGSCMLCLATFFSTLLVIVTFPLTIWFCFKVIQEYERAVIFRLGRLRSGGARGPGTFFILPCIDDYRCLDLRSAFYDIPPQEVLTRDSLTVSVDAVIYYRIFDPVAAVANVMYYDASTRLLAATMLRNVLGTKNLAEILTDRESISALMKVALDEATDVWGVKVERVEMKDVRLPIQMQRAMAAEAEAAREARAKIIAAEGEMNASKALKQAADVMVSSPGALQLRYLQTLGTIAAERNSTIIFPLPIDLLAPFARRNIDPRTTAVNFSSSNINTNAPVPTIAVAVKPSSTKSNKNK